MLNRSSLSWSACLLEGRVSSLGKVTLVLRACCTLLILLVKRYLKWTSVKAEVFNVGKYRRSDNPHPDAKFFDVNNPEGEKARRAAAEAAVEDMLSWFEDKDNKVAILDATNSTKSRRKWIYDKIQADGRLLRTEFPFLLLASRLTAQQTSSLRANATMRQ